MELLGEERGPRELDEVGLQWEKYQETIFSKKIRKQLFSSKTISLEMHKEGFQPFCFKNINLTLHMIIYLVVVDIQIHVAVHINALYSGRDIKLLLLGFLVKMLILV